MIGALFLAVAMPADVGPVIDPVRCQVRVETRLHDLIRLLFDQANQGPEFYILDGSTQGDLALAASFMRQHGWIGWASDKPEDQKKLYLVPNSTEMRDYPIGKPEDGPKLACTASWMSGVPFVSVIRRSQDLSTVVYEVKP